MQYLKGFTSYNSESPCAVTFGKFDGIHAGHQKLIEKVHELSQQNTVKSVVCAFDMFKRVQITSVGEKEALLFDKIDCFIDCPFTDEIRKMDCETFISKIICETLHATFVVVGSDFRFGYKASGNVETLARFSKCYGYTLLVIEKEKYDGRKISSTFIREALEEGNIGLANRLLGYPYGICGRVEKGKQLGRKLGFPTINISWPLEKIYPPFGVYYTHVYVDGKRWNAISNLGVRPTVTSVQEVYLESFILDYSGDLYGENVKVELIDFARNEEKFSDLSELKMQVASDIEKAKKFFENLTD